MSARQGKNNTYVIVYVLELPFYTRLILIEVISALGFGVGFGLLAVELPCFTAPDLTSVMAELTLIVDTTYRLHEPNRLHDTSLAHHITNRASCDCGEIYACIVNISFVAQ